MQTFQGKSVVITGAASGIGEALALALAQRGARLLLADIDPGGLERVANAARAHGATCQTQVTDTGSEADIAALATTAIQQLGGTDILINNAGVALVSPVAKLQPTDAQWLMNINFWGVAHGCRLFLPQMQTRPKALLVNVSSIFAMVSMPTQSIYNASKAAVRAFSDSLREELRDTPVGVLCVHPGGIKTNIANKARVTDSSMVAASDAAFRSHFDKAARTTPAQAADTIIRAIESGKTRVLIGADAKVLDWMFRLFPARASRWFTNLNRALTQKTP